MNRPWRRRTRGRRRLLLGAALLDGEEAIDSWRRFGGNAGLETIDPDGFGLLPLVYRNIAGQGVATGGLQRLRSVYKHAWYRNQLLIGAGAEALAALGDAGLPTLILRGTALGVAYYGDVGLRPSENVAVLVPPTRATEAVATLRRAGWEAVDARVESAVQRRDAAAFRGPMGHGVSLHWRLHRGPDADAWEAALPAEVCAVATTRLCPADELLALCVDAPRVGAGVAGRWTADAVTVLRGRGGEIDWRRFVEQASVHQLTPACRTALGQLDGTFGVSIPDGVIDALGRGRRRDVTANVPAL